MPEHRLARTRETLPSGYQFGDMGRQSRRPTRMDALFGFAICRPAYVGTRDDVGALFITTEDKWPKSATS